MERPSVWVINNSPTIRETIAIVLGDRYRVQGVSAAEYARDPSRLEAADVLLVGSDSLPAPWLRTLPKVPVLWLQAPGAAPAAHTRQAVLPYPFTPDDLRARVEALLANRAAVGSSWGERSSVDYPILPADAAMLARRAAGTRFPILICGEAGTGKARLARAIHSLGGNGHFLALSASQCTAASLQQAATISPGDMTLFITEVAEVTHDTEPLLLEVIERGGFASAAGWHNVRLVCATTHSFDGLARLQGAHRELLYKISVFPITLPPLRERSADIPALARHIVAELGQLLGLEPITFTPRAIDRLVHYLWFGNVAELETVLTRSVVITERRDLDAEDLLFGYGRLMPRARQEAAVVPDAAAAPSPAGETVDLIINELAHEFKNPMVTIKTVAQHLERLLADQTGREQVARLTGEAVDRMDRALENLLQFTRFRAPVAADVLLNTLLSPRLNELAPTLAERRILLSYRPPEPLSVFVDAAQVAYAFENLLRVITRDLPEGQTLSVRTLEGTTAVTIEFTGGGQALTGKLSEFLDHSPAVSASVLPLGMVFAKSLIERNGGRIDLHTQPDVTAITVWLPSREEIAPQYGKTASLSH